MVKCQVQPSVPTSFGGVRRKKSGTKPLLTWMVSELSPCGPQAHGDQPSASLSPCLFWRWGRKGVEAVQVLYGWMWLEGQVFINIGNTEFCVWFVDSLRECEKLKRRIFSQKDFGKPFPFPLLLGLTYLYTSECWCHSISKGYCTSWLATFFK